MAGNPAARTRKETMTNQPTCEQRVEAERDGRLSDFGALADLMEVADAAELAVALEDRATRELFAELVYDCATRELTDADAIAGMDPVALETALDAISLDAVRERAEQRAYDLPLGVSSFRVFRVDLSTGGPADWLEVRTSGDTPVYESGGEPYEVESVTYHFADWFDHAARELEGVELDIATRFVERVIPELAG